MKMPVFPCRSLRVFRRFAAATLSSTRTVVVPTAMTRRPAVLASFTARAVSSPSSNRSSCILCAASVSVFTGSKCAGADVQRDKADFHAACADFFQQFPREMQAGRRCGHRTVGRGHKPSGNVPGLPPSRPAGAGCKVAAGTSPSRSSSSRMSGVPENCSRRWPSSFTSDDGGADGGGDAVGCREG